MTAFAMPSSYSLANPQIVLVVLTYDSIACAGKSGLKNNNRLVAESLGKAIKNGYP